MTTLAPAAPAGAARTGSPAGTLRSLGALEARRYATHPLFIAGCAVTTTTSVMGPDVDTSSLFHAIVPAAAIGLAGIVLMWLLTRRSDAASSAAGAVPVGEAVRTGALALAGLVPFTAGLAWWIWAMAAYEVHPPTVDGFPFGPADNARWVGSVLFVLGPLACLGGPLLGLLVARWTTGRAAPAVAVVGVIAASIVMQGLFDPLIRARVVMPWTYWGGPLGVEGDDQRMKVLPGNPHWWLLYVACLNAGGLVLALLHDREGPRRRLLLVAGALLAVAIPACLLAMWTGIPETLANPVPSRRGLWP
jgi:hypothetical protein